MDSSTNVLLSELLFTMFVETDDGSPAMLRTADMSEESEVESDVQQRRLGAVRQ